MDIDTKKDKKPPVKPYTIDEMVFDGHMHRERLLETLQQAYEEHLKKAAKP